MAPARCEAPCWLATSRMAIDAAPTLSAWSAALEALIPLLREGLGNWPLFGAPKWPRTTANLG